MISGWGEVEEDARAAKGVRMDEGRGSGDSRMETAADWGKGVEEGMADEAPRTMTWRWVLLRAVSRREGGAGDQQA